MKDEVLKLARRKESFTWKNNQISVDHDYAPAILARQREYAEARKVLKGNNIRFQTSRVFYEEKTRTYEMAMEAVSELANRGLLVKVIT